MMTRFKTLFSLEVRHDYYGGVCPDIGFVVPQDTAELMRGAGMVARGRDGAFHVLYRADEGGAPISPAGGKTVRIGLVVRDPRLANITQGFDPASGALHVRNQQVATALDEPPARVVLRDVNPELWREGAFGLVEIAIAPAFYASAPAYQIGLEARVEPLRYYVVVKGFSSGDLDQLAVQEQTPGQPGEVKFEKVPPAQLSADEKSRTEILATDGAKVLLFKSTTAVARRERSGKQIQLMRNTEPLVERLPQPGRDRGTSDLIVHVSKSKP
jgi:hypothetical protein